MNTYPLCTYDIHSLCSRSQALASVACIPLTYVVRRRGRLAPRQPLSVCALLPALREEQASKASWEPRPPFEVAEMD